MKIKQILSRGCILANLEAKTKDEVLSEMARLISQNFENIPFEETVVTLREREELGSTGIGNGVAIPHGKISALSQIITAFGRSIPGIDYDSQDGKPAHLFFVLLAPENAASLHLKALARLSRLLKESSFRQKLMEAQDAGQIYESILSEDEKF